MGYNPTTWKDQIVTNPTKYEIRKQDGSKEIVDIERVPEEIVQQGTKITAERLNNIEQGVKGNVNEIDRVTTQMADLATNKMDKEIADDSTLKKYELGINNGLLYYREVVE